MAITAGADTVYSSLIEDGRVHSAIFTDEAIYQAELERIFYKYWVYLAHESEVPEPGDYVTKWIGQQHIIVARTDEGEVRAFFNRCRHRGTTVCNYESGHGSYFRCPYHGWTYSNEGNLIGVPFPTRYGPEFHKEDLGLVPVPHLDQHRGFVFVNLAVEAPPLLEHLGRAAELIDLFVSASPSEKVVVRAGASKSNFRGNWKFVGMDGYHVNFTHKTVLDLQKRRQTDGGVSQGGNTDRAPNLTVDLGGGHVRLDLSRTVKIEVGSKAATQVGRIPDNEAGRSYIASLVERWGSEEAAFERILRARDVHLHVWPNLQLIGTEIRVIRPMAAGCTEVTGYPSSLADVPDEINESRLRGYEWFNGVAGFGSPDDREVFERNQIGLVCDTEPWLILSRGINQAETEEDGVVVGNVTDELTQRGQMRKWAEAMG